MLEKYRYSLSYLPSHLLIAKRWDLLCTLLTNLNFLKRKGESLSIYALLSDYVIALDRLPKEKDGISLVKQAYHLVDANSYMLQDLWPEPLNAFFLQQLRNAAFDLGFDTYSRQAETDLQMTRAVWLKLLYRSDNQPVWTSRVLAGHHHIIHSLAFSPDGKLLATGSYNGEIRFWEAETGRCIYTISCNIENMRGNSHIVADLDFSPDGKILASAVWDNSVRLWNVETGQEIACLKEHTDVVRSVKFSPDGIRLASGSSDHTICLWSATDGSLLSVMNRHSDTVCCVAFSPDGQIFASCGHDREIILWDVATAQILKQFRGHSKPVWHIAFDPSGQLLVSTALDNTLRIWSLSSADEIHRIEGFEASVFCAAFSPDGRILATAANDGWESMLRLWDTNTFKEIARLEGHTTTVWKVAFSSDGRLLASCSSDRTARIWSVNQMPDMQQRSDGHARRVRRISVSLDGRYVVSSDVDATTRVWQVSSNRTYFQLPTDPSIDIESALSPNGRSVATATERCLLQLWDANTGYEQTRILHSGERIIELTFSHDGKLLATAHHDGTVRVWSGIPASLKLVATWSINKNHNQCHSLAFRCNKQLLALGTNNGQIEFWNWASIQCVFRQQISTGSTINALAVSPDGQTFATGTDDCIVRVWTLTDGLVHRLMGHTHWVRALAFSPDGRWLVSGGWDRFVRLWNTRDWRLTAAHMTRDAVGDIQFHPKRDRIIVADIARNPNIYTLDIVTHC